MSAPEIRVDQQALAIRARLRVVNSSGETWKPEDGYAVGYQILDPDTDTLVVDGRRSPLARPLAPGESVDAEVEVELPPEHGRYRVFVSSMRENVCWHYQQGTPFLLIEAEVGEAGARLVRSAETTMGALRRRNLVRAFGRGFQYPLALLWRNRSLIRSMVRRDVLGRYRGSFGGVFWTLLNPLLLMTTYFFVFGIVLRARFHNDPSRAGFVLYFLCGMLPWLAFSEAAGRAPFVILEYRNFVKKLVFPLETLPVNLTAAGLVTELFALVVFVAGLLLARGGVPATAAWLPLLLIPQLLLTLGLCWFLAALGVYVRDLGQINGFLLTLWFFLTPICYPVESLPPQAMAILAKNPFFVLVQAYRDIFLEGRAPSFGPLWKLWLLSAVLFLLGHAWFYKLKRNFADVI
ncbi:MAG: ABC transporter permease [Bryobacteraceae bacterium]|jgi:lipopolysaccharide transport system permease protein